MAEVLSRVGDVLVLAAGVGIAVFAVSYGLFFRWTKTPSGKAVMFFVLSLLATVTLGWLRVLFDGEEHIVRDIARVVLMAGVAFAAWRMVWVLWRNWAYGTGASMSSRRDDPDPPEEGGDPERT